MKRAKSGASSGACSLREAASSYGFTVGSWAEMRHSSVMSPGSAVQAASRRFGARSNSPSPLLVRRVTVTCGAAKYASSSGRSAAVSRASYSN